MANDSRASDDASIRRLKGIIEKEKFFHDIVISGLRTGTFVYDPSLPSNYHLFPTFQFLKELDLKEARCLDLGTFDGMTAFVMAELGARCVDATCQYELERFHAVAEVGRWQNLNYHPNSEIDSLRDRFGDAAFDVVSMSAMLHHLVSPLDGLFISRNLMRLGGFLILEAAVHDNEQVTVVLNTEVPEPVFGTPTLWIPSVKALEGMARLASFSVVARTVLRGTSLGRETNYRRVTLLCKADRPSGVEGRSKPNQAIHNLSPWRERIDYKRLEALDQTPARTAYSGKPGQRNLNIFDHHPSAPLQPTWSDPHPARTSCFRLGTVDQFMALMSRHEEYQWTDKDIFLLAAKYPGETFPEGQGWSLKQFGNLFCIDHILKWEPESVLEIGPGFNHYFENRLPKWIDYSIIDDAGFYEKNLISLSNDYRKRSKIFNGLVGKPNDLKDSSFDLIFSVSVLEHVGLSDIESAATDMVRILRPGGWAVHSLDVASTNRTLAMRWLDAFRKAGFLFDPASIDLDLDQRRPTGFELFCEPLSIIQRFHGGYRPEPWRGPRRQLSSNVHTVLIAARKPQ